MNSLLRTMIGETFIKFKSDPFVFSNNVFECVGLYIGSRVFMLQNSLMLLDYYGSEEEICVLKLLAAESSDLKSAFLSVNQIDNYINRGVKKIQLVQEHKVLSKNEEIEYDIHLTRGLIFCFDDDLEIAFEKTNPFIGNIAISRGYDLLKGFTPEENDKTPDMNGYGLITNRYLENIQ